MSEIRIQKIDWVEFVTYKDYLRVKEEKQELEYLWDINEELKEENRELESLSAHKTEMAMRLWKIKDELEEENKKLKEYNWELIENHKKDIAILCEENKNLKSDLEQFSEAYKRYRDYEKEELAESCYDLERENQKLKERIAELEKCNLNLLEYIDKLLEYIDKLLNHKE